MGRPIGSGEKLEERRQRAVEMVEKEELSQAEAARRLKVDARTVRKWIQWHRGRGARDIGTRRTPGRPTRLGAPERKKLTAILLKGPKAAGYSNDLWTCRRVAEVIFRELGIEYHPNHVGRLLRKLGWSPQKPETRAVERDDKKVRAWKQRTMPAIKKKPSA
jgi:transposase